MNIPTYYKDNQFCNSAEARPFRILSEYLGPRQRLMQHNINHTIVFFGSARISSPEQFKAKEGKACFLSAKYAEKATTYYEKARQLAYKLTQWSFNLPDDLRPYIITGGGPGIMEAGNRGGGRPFNWHDHQSASRTRFKPLLYA